MPPGWVRVSRTVSGEVADLNSGSGGSNVFLCFKRGHGLPLSDVKVRGWVVVGDLWVLIGWWCVVLWGYRCVWAGIRPSHCRRALHVR